MRLLSNRRGLLAVASGLLLGLLLVPRSAPVPQPASEQALGEIRAEPLRAHLRFLADDLLEGRGTATRGYLLAARYVAAQFEALGLEPAGSNATYFQSVPLRKTELVKEEAALSLVRTGQEEKLTYGEHFLMLGDSLRPESGVSAPVAFVGFGVTAPELGYDDYAGLDVRGKIVAFVQGAPASFPHNQRAYYSSTRVKRDNAVARGAVGILAFRSPEAEQRFSWQRIVRQSRGVGMVWLDPSGVPGEVSPHLQGGALLSGAGAAALFAGAPKTLDEVFATAKDGKVQGFDLPVEARLRRVSRHTSMESPNVAALLRGSDPVLRHEYVVFTAHLDHLGIGAAVEGDSIYNGAFDNAAGIAYVLEIARAFTRLPQRPRRSLLFLAVTGEEEGLLGSDYFAHFPTVPREQIVANVNLDAGLMLYSPRDIVAFGAEHSSLASPVARAAARLGLQVSPDPFPEEVFFIRSDQYSFVRQGIPAVDLFPGLQTGDPQKDGAALFRQWMQTRYHSPKDDFDQPMNLEAGVRFARVNFLIGLEVANTTARPAWNPGDFFAQKFARPAAPSGRAPATPATSPR